MNLLSEHEKEVHEMQEKEEQMEHGLDEIKTNKPTVECDKHQCQDSSEQTSDTETYEDQTDKIKDLEKELLAKNELITQLQVKIL